MDVFKVLAATVPFLLVFAKDGPQFLGPGSNVTVVEGRDATFTCRMENLHHYKVAWLRVDTQTILTIGPHVITKNYRVAVTRVDPQSWTLTLRETRPADEGQYMCQINTEPMITQTHHLQVVVPPDIVDVSSSGEVLAREGDNVTLHCEPTGNPAPTVTWRREDGAGFRVAGRTVNKWSGTWLNMSDVTREQNGAFLCIATNGVPPSVSRRVLLRILCAPSVWAVHNMVGGYSGAAVHLQCAAEANPAPAVYWTHVDLSRLQDGSKYTATVQPEGYRHTASLLVSNLSRDDVGTYHCHVENALGKARAGITLYTLATTTTAVSETTETSTTTLYEVEELEPTQSIHVLDTNIEKKLENDRDDKSSSDQDNFVAVLSQHQMQNLDISPSS